MTGSEADMAYFAQVGATPASSNGNGDTAGGAFDPLSSRKYSQPAKAPEPSVQPQATVPTFPDFGLNAAPSPAPQPPKVRISSVTRPSFGQNTQTPQPRPEPTAPFAAAANDTPYAHDFGAAFAAGEDDSFDEPARGELGKMATVLGAAASLALVVGISVWGYKLIMRDVSGVPVVSAVSGPMRELPPDPGGELADNQGLAVNAVAANGTAEAPANTLRLAPEPIELAADDQPLLALEQAANERALREQAAAADMGLASQQAEAIEESPLEQRSQDIDALVASLTADVEPLEELRDTSAPAGLPTPVQTDLEPQLPSAVQRETIPQSVLNAPGVRVTPRPQVRPARFSPAPVALDTATRAIDVDPAKLTVGTRLAQLGAYESADVAQTEWARISARFGDFFDGKQRVIQRAESGGRIFYRLRAHGFADLSDARRFCSALVAGNADCIPVAVR